MGPYVSGVVLSGFFTWVVKQKGKGGGETEKTRRKKLDESGRRKKPVEASLPSETLGVEKVAITSAGTSRKLPPKLQNITHQCHLSLLLKGELVVLPHLPPTPQQTLYYARERLIGDLSLNHNQFFSGPFNACINSIKLALSQNNVMH